MKQAEGSVKGDARNTVLSLYLPALILALGTGIAAPALPVYAKSFEVSFGLASLVIVLNNLGGLASTIPTGYLIDRLGRRKVVIAGPVLTALSSFLVATAQSFPELLLYRFLGGWGQQMWVLGRLAIIADTGGERRGRQITGLFGTDALGRLLGPAVGGLIAYAWDIRLPFVVYGFLALLSLVPTVHLVRETRPSGGRASSRAEKDSLGYLAMLRECLAGPLLVMFAAQLLSSLTRGSLFGGTLDLYAVYNYHVGPEVIGGLAAVSSAIGVPITFSTGHLMDRFGRKATIVPGLSLLGAGLAFMAVTAFVQWPFWTYVVAFMWVRIALSSVSGSMQVLGSDVAPAHARGTFFGLWRLTSEVGTLLSPLFFAIIAEYLGYGSSFLWLSATGLSAALLIGVRVKETLPTRKAVESPAGGQT